MVKIKMGRKTRRRRKKYIKIITQSPSVLLYERVVAFSYSFFIFYIVISSLESSFSTFWKKFKISKIKNYVHAASAYFIDDHLVESVKSAFFVLIKEASKHKKKINKRFFSKSLEIDKSSLLTNNQVRVTHKLTHKHEIFNNMRSVYKSQKMAMFGGNFSCKQNNFMPFWV